MIRRQSYDRKLRQMRQLLDQQHATTIHLQSQRFVTWLTGMRSHINVAASAACADLFITQEDVVLFVNNIEAARLVEEELVDIPVKVASYDWWNADARASVLRQIQPQSADVLSEAHVSSALIDMQQTLDEWEAAEFVRLGADCAYALEAACKQVRPGQSEYAFAAMIAQALRSNGIDPVVLLVAADERSRAWRHPLPTDRPIHRYAFASICGRRRGLIISATRAIHFGPADEELLERHRMVSQVDATLIANTVPETTLGELFSVLRDTYAGLGMADEWKNHHQGGLTGYLPRTQLALPDDSTRLRVGMPVAWNPTIAGVKSEDTSLVVPHQPARLLTFDRTHDWPYLSFKVNGVTVDRPDILIRD